MEKILDDYFEKPNAQVRICDSPEEIAETLKINKEMRKVVRDYRHRAALSWKKARGFVFQNNHFRS